jgi:hypothetical protein
MNTKLVAKVKRLYEQHTEQEVLQAIDWISEQSIWDNMACTQREQFFRDQCKKLKLTVYEGTGSPARCLFVEQMRSHDGIAPYFMFWRESTSHKDRGHIEFGHYHMDRKLEKQYPGTEYCYGGPKEQARLMKHYADQIGK